MITKGFLDRFFHGAIYLRFLFKEIILEQFIMKWIDPFCGCAVFVQNGGGGIPISVQDETGI